MAMQFLDLSVWGRVLGVPSRPGLIAGHPVPAEHKPAEPDPARTVQHRTPRGLGPLEASRNPYKTKTLEVSGPSGPRETQSGLQFVFEFPKIY